MAGKITIRRKGGCLPLLCLLLLLAVVVLVVWLSTLGAPGFVVRHIERQAAQHGVYLRIGSLTLAPTSGFAVEAAGIELRAAETDSEPLASLSRVVVQISPIRLLTGNMLPTGITLAEGKVNLPVEGAPGEHLHLTLSGLEARSSGDYSLAITDTCLDLEGITLRPHGVLDLSPYFAPATAQDARQPGDNPAQQDLQEEVVQRIDLAEMIVPFQPRINEAYRTLRRQQWAPNQIPVFDVEFQVGENVSATLQATVPQYDLDQFRFCQAKAKLEYRDNTVIIHNLGFRVYEFAESLSDEAPASNVRVQGGYNTDTRELSFNLKSDAPLIRMAGRLLPHGKLKDLLAKITHPEKDHPSIRLNGNVIFSPDFTPGDVSVQGEFHQENLSIGGSSVRDAHLSFLYDNGNFNINRCLLAMPDGKVDLTASLRDRAGKAMLQADIDVARLLALVSEFTDGPVTLPQGLSLTGNTRLKLDLDLHTAPLVPSEDDWQDIVPQLEKLSLSADVDEAQYDGVHLTRPSVAITADGIEQGSDMLPTAIREMNLHVGAQKAQWTEGADAEEAGLDKLDISLNCSGGIIFSDLLGDRPYVSVPASALSLSAENLSRGDIGVEGVTLTLTADKGLRLGDELADILQSARLETHARGLRHGDTALGAAILSIDLDEGKPDTLQLTLSCTDTADVQKLRISTQADWLQADRISLQNISAKLSPAFYAPLLEAFGISTNAIEWPQELSISGSVDWDTKAGQLDEGQLHVSIPELVRTPQKVKALIGRNVSLAIEADAYLKGKPEGGFTYDTTLDVRQKTGAFKGKIVGDSIGRFTVTGENTIRADVVDSLIDLNDSHCIIRDFRFTDASKNIVSNIKVNVDLTDAGGGVRVDSDCDAELFNVAYMLGGIEVTPEGVERPRKDLGADPFTHCPRVSCSVRVHVVDSCTNPDGTRHPYECTITLGNAKMEFDNSPWLARQKFSTGARRTNLTGDSIIIDVGNSFVEINNIRGSVYPAYSFGMFYPPLQNLMSDVLFYSPPLVETNQCVFPIYSDCKRPMSGVILATCTPESGFRFIGTTIPLRNFSGFIYITDKYVQLDKLNALCWQGVLDAVVKIGFSGKNTTFDGYARANAMSLKKIAAAYGSAQRDALCDAEIRFRSNSANLKDLDAYGYAHIRDGDLLSTHLFSPVLSLISDIPGYFSKLNQLASRNKTQKNTKAGPVSTGISNMLSLTGKALNASSQGLESVVPFANHLLCYNLKEAYSRFTIDNGHLVTNGMKVKGSNLKITANLNIDLDKMQIHGDMWPQIYSLPAVILSPVTFLSEYIIDITVDGPVNDLKFGMKLDTHHGRSPSASSSPPSE